MKNLTLILFFSLSLIAAACGGTEGNTGQGDPGQACYPNATCNTGLICVAGTCVADDGSSPAFTDTTTPVTDPGASDASAQDTQAPPTTDDTGTAPTDTTSGPADTTALSDATSLDDSGSEPVQTGNFGDPCATDDDCFSGLCLAHLGDSVCSKTCDSECPAGWSCEQVQLGSSDPTFICVSNFEHLCSPCVGQSDCESDTGQAACVDYEGEGGFCGASCEADADCPSGFICQESTSMSGGTSTQCVLEDGLCDCSAQAIELGLATECSVTNEYGTCTAVRGCSEDGLAPCEAATPEPESCNAIDDDCDGEIDEGEPCDDDDPCTLDTCLSSGECTNDIMIGAACDDGDPGTKDDACQADGSCAGEETPCPYGPCILDAVAIGETCDVTYKPSGAACDDNDTTTKNDSCDGAGGCLGTTYTCEPGPCELASEPNGQGCDVLYWAAGQPCDDSDPSTSDDICDGQGTCQGTVYGCVPGPCTVSSEPDGDGCLEVHLPQGAACDDGDSGTKFDACDGEGGCAGQPYTCEVGTCQTAATPNGFDCDAVYSPQGAACDDGVSGTKDDACDGEGFCAGVPFTCEPGPCEISSVPNGEGCVALPQPVGTPCDDDNVWTTDDACDGAGGCVGLPADCPLGPCDASATPEGDGCAVVPKPAGTACDDGNPSTKGDLCDGGSTCMGTPYVCTPTQCEASSTPDGSGCSVTYWAGGYACDDGNPNTKDDICNGAGACIGTPFTCPGPSQCVTSVTPNDGECLLNYQVAGVACNDGDNTTKFDACDGAGGCAGEAYTCEVSACVLSASPNGFNCDNIYSPNGSPCDDDDAETKDDVCDAAGQCLGETYTCEPGPCEVTSVPNGEDCDVTLKVEGSACNDGVPGTINDTCDAQGLCAGTLIECPLGPCHQSSTPDGDTCVVVPKPVGVTCDDQNAGTKADACDAAGDCVGTPYTCTPTDCQLSSTPNGVGCDVTFWAYGQPCDDGNAATTGDICDGQGGCQGETYECAPTQCQASSTPDGDGCIVTNHPAGVSCSDGDENTQFDACDGDGSCVGQPYTCDVSACVDSATPNGFDCDYTYTVAGAACDDDDLTTMGDACDGSGSCEGVAYSCEPGPCQESSTHNGTDCDTINIPEGTDCDDQDPGTKDDTCDSAGQCVGDEIVCVAGPCDASAVPNGTGCAITPKAEGASCDDGEMTTKDDVCDADGVCEGETYTCTPGACEATSTPNGAGCTVTYEDGVACDDGDECTSGTTCQQGACTGGIDACLCTDETGDIDEDGDGYAPCAGDCDDQNPLVHPGAPEICGDGVDNDCSGDTDIADIDGDGYAGCGGDDCNDFSDWVHPGAIENMHDGLDNDCDGVVDAFDVDDDLDGRSEADGDCDDAKPWIHPGATDIPDNGIDEDCNDVDATAVDDYPHAIYLNPNPEAAANFLANDGYPGTPDLPVATITEAVIRAGFANEPIFVAQGEMAVPTLGLSMSIYGGYAYDSSTGEVDWSVVAGRTDFTGDINFAPETTRLDVASRLDIVGHTRFTAQASAILHDSSVRLNPDEPYPETLYSETGHPMVALSAVYGHDFDHADHSVAVKSGTGGIEIHFSEIIGGAPGGSSYSASTVSEAIPSNRGTHGIATCADGSVEGGPEVWKRSDMAYCQSDSNRLVYGQNDANTCGAGSHVCTQAEVEARWDQAEAPAGKFYGKVEGSDLVTGWYGDLDPFALGTQTCDGQLIHEDNEGWRCYKRFDSNASSWGDARNKCEAWGGHLLTLRSGAEWQAVHDNVLGTHGSHYYIGAIYEGSTSCCCNNGCNKGNTGLYNWKYQGGGTLPSVYQNWRSGEPNDPNGYCCGNDDHHAVFMHHKNTDSSYSGRFYNGDDDDDRGYICERGVEIPSLPVDEQSLLVFPAVVQGLNTPGGSGHCGPQFGSHQDSNNSCGMMCCTNGPGTTSASANPEQMSEITNSLIVGGKGSAGSGTTPGGNVTLVLGGARIVGSLLTGGAPGTSSGGLAGTWEGVQRTDSVLSSRIVQKGAAIGQETPQTMPSINLARQTPENKCEERLFEGHTYRICDTYTTMWDTAKSACRDWGGYLTTITTPAENDFLSAFLSGNAWIGYNDLQAENSFAWDGAATTTYYENWDSSEPNSDGANNEDCSYVNSSGVWFDTYCDTELRYICEKDHVVPSASVRDCSITTHEGSEYALCTASHGQGGDQGTAVGRSDWHSAQQRCDDWGGDLAVLETTAETDYLDGLLTEHTWVSGTQGESCSAVGNGLWPSWATAEDAISALGVANGDSFTIEVPVTAGGEDGPVTITIGSNPVATDHTIMINWSQAGGDGSDDIAKLIRMAVNGEDPEGAPKATNPGVIFSADAIVYATEGTRGASGVKGLIASQGSHSKRITLTSDNPGAGGNDTTLANISGDLVLETTLSGGATASATCTDNKPYVCERAIGMSPSEVEVMATAVMLEAGQTMDLTRIELGTSASTWGFTGVLADSVTDASVTASSIHIASDKRALGAWVSDGTFSGNEVALKAADDSTAFVHHDASMPSYNNTLVVDSEGTALQLSGDSGGAVNTLMSVASNGTCMMDHAHDSSKSVLSANRYEGCGGFVYADAGYFYAIPAFIGFKGAYPECDATFTDGDGILFSSPLLWLYDLQVNSPAIDAGIPLDTIGITESKDYDLMRNPRIQGATIDRGAHEYQAP
ncbi:MAG: lectin-like protein [Myxococcota bacterium]